MVARGYVVHQITGMVMTFSKAPEYGYRYMVPVVALQFVTCDRKVCMHEEESGDSHG